MAKKKSSLSTVVAFMSEQAQDRVNSQAKGEQHIPISTIRPDPEQPRRLLPADLSDALVHGSILPTEALKEWLIRAEKSSDETAIARNVRELQRLADSIAQHGLIQSVTVRPVDKSLQVPAGVEYLIITGERRYWAHLLLVIEGQKIHEGIQLKEPDQIRVNMPAEGVSIRAHQLIENLLREDIDAVEKAEGFLALGRELAEQTNHGSPENIDWHIVEQTLGVSTRYRQYVMSVLGLSEEAQQMVLNYGFTERMIRPISQKLKKYPDLQLIALAQLVRWQKENSEDDEPGRPLTTSLKDFVDELLARQSQSPTNHGSLRFKPSETRNISVPVFHRKIKTVLKQFDKIEHEDWQLLVDELSFQESNVQALEDLRELHRQVDDLLRVVNHRQLG